MNHNENPKSNRGIRKSLSNFGHFFKRHPRILLLGSILVILCILFIAAGGTDDVVEYIDNEYVKVSSTETSKGFFNTYETDKSLTEVYEDILNKHPPKSVKEPSASAFVLLYPKTSVSLKGDVSGGTIITVDADDGRRTQEAIFQALVYVLAELADALEDASYDDYNSSSGSDQSSSSWQDVEEPETGGSGIFYIQDENYDDSGSNDSGSFNLDDLGVDTDNFDEPGTYEGSGNFWLQEEE